MSKILSICITTYNRKKYLEECLNSILRQNNVDKIDIIISDNASTDGTDNFIKEYIEKNKGKTNIKYFRNKKNIGACGNITNLPIKTNSDYIRFLSDDDVLADDKNTICHVIDNIEKYNPSMMFLNFCVFDKELKNTLFENQLKIEKDFFFDKGTDFVSFLKMNNYGFMGLMSCNIYKRKGYSKEKFKYIQNLIHNGKEVGYPHMELYFEDLKNKTVFLDHVYCIKGRGDNSIWDIGKYLSYQKEYCKIFINQGIRPHFFKKIILNQVCFYPIYKLSSLFNGTIFYRPLSRIRRHSVYALYLRIIGQNKTNKGS